MQQIPKSGEFYRHFKNKLYQILTVAEHTEDGQKLVIYQALYGEFKTYARPLEMFLSEVDHEKYPDVEQKYRFEKVILGVCEEAEVSAVDLEEKVQMPVQKVEIQQDEITANVSLEESTEELPDAGLMEFLDTDDWDMRYNILVSLRDKMTDHLVDSLAVVMDVVIPEGPIEERYKQLKYCLQTRQKYENSHLR